MYAVKQSLYCLILFRCYCNQKLSEICEAIAKVERVELNPAVARAIEVEPLQNDKGDVIAYVDTIYILT